MRSATPAREHVGTDSDGSQPSTGITHHDFRGGAHAQFESLLALEVKTRSK